MDDKGRVHDAGASEEKQKGEAYFYGDQELIRQLVKLRMAQKSELEYESLDGYMLPPRTQFSMLNKPAVSIRYGRGQIPARTLSLYLRWTRRSCLH